MPEILINLIRFAIAFVFSYTMYVLMCDRFYWAFKHLSIWIDLPPFFIAQVLFVLLWVKTKPKMSTLPTGYGNSL